MEPCQRFDVDAIENALYIVGTESQFHHLTMIIRGTAVDRELHKTAAKYAVQLAG